MPSTVLSALTQAMASCERKESFFTSGYSDARYSGNLDNQGLKVMKSGGLRATERMATGATRLKTNTAPVTANTTRLPDRRPTPIPRSVCAIAANAARAILGPLRAVQDT